jgi:hypothetical protein
MDLAVVKALKEKKELQRRLAEIDQFLRLYREFSEEEGDNSNVKTAPDDAYEPAHADKKKSVSKLKFRGPSSVVRISKGILQDFGFPLTRGELAAELEMKMVHLPGKDKESRARYVGTILWRNPDDFEHVEGKGYWLKDVPIPESEQERRDLRERDLI